MFRSLRAALLGAACCVFFAGTGLAQAREIDVPAGDMDEALSVYIKQSGFSYSTG
jgi:hypothetical protein